MRTMMLVTALALGAGCATESTTTNRDPDAPKHAPAPGAPTVTSEQNDAIDAVFKRKAPALQRCWAEEYERSKNRGLQGEITVTMTISKAGKPTDLKAVKSTIGVPAVDKCVLDEVATWNFAEGPADAPYRRTVHLGSAY